MLEIFILGQPKDKGIARSRHNFSRSYHQRIWIFRRTDLWTIDDQGSKATSLKHQNATITCPEISNVFDLENEDKEWELSGMKKGKPWEICSGMPLYVRACIEAALFIRVGVRHAVLAPPGPVEYSQHRHRQTGRLSHLAFSLTRQMTTHASFFRPRNTLEICSSVHMCGMHKFSEVG
jgi:hypothetical protein